MMAGAERRTECGWQSAAPMARREASAPSDWLTGAEPQAERPVEPVLGRPFIATLEVACCLCHNQLRFFVIEACHLVDKMPGFFPFQNLDLLIMPVDEHLFILAYSILEYFTSQHIAFINLGHSVQRLESRVRIVTVLPKEAVIPSRLFI